MANIFQQYLQPIRTVGEQRDMLDARDLRREQLIGAQRQNALAALTAQQTQDQMAQAAEDRNMLIRLAQQYAGNQQGYEDALAGSGRPGLMTQAQAIRKARLEAQKTESENREREGKTLGDRLKLYAGLLDTHVRTPEAAAMWAQAQYADPVLGPLMPKLHGPIEQFVSQIPSTPEAFEPWRQQSFLGISKYAESVEPKPKEVRLGNRVAIIDENPRSPTFRQELSSSAVGESPDNAATVAATLAGQRLIDARARERLAFDRAQAAQAVTYQTDADGNIVAMPTRLAPGVTPRAMPVLGPSGVTPLKGKEAGMTDGQSKALLFGTRAKEADKALTTLAESGTQHPALIKSTAERVPVVGQVAGDVINTLPGVLGGPNSAQQRVEQAQRDFINAVLRRESGAVISDQEFDNARRQYFPARGDSEETLAQKAANRKTAIAGILAEVPERLRVLNVDGGAKPSSPGGGPKFLGFE